MFLNDKQREYAQQKLKWHKWPDEKPKVKELCRILCKDYQRSIIPIAFLNRYNTWEDYDEFFCVYKDVKYWMYEKEFNEALNNYN